MMLGHAGEGENEMMREPSVRVAVAAHKPYRMPVDGVYLPLHVGRALHPDAVAAMGSGFAGDDTGDSISEKNPNYCELTGLYWAWKNVDADWLGLVHYRRHFAARLSGEKFSRIASGDQLRERLAESPVILPKKRNYLIETNYSQYVHAHHEQDLVQTRAIISELCPEYLDAYDGVMARTTGHRFNMFVMRRDLLDAYCAWLFGILFELERRLDISGYSANDARVFGFVSERLLDPWIEANGVPYVEMPVVNLEDQHWARKGTRFLKRKFTGATHGRSF